MKHFVLIVLTSSCTVECMQPADIIIHHFAQHLAGSVLHPDNRCTPDAAIDYSKEILKDPTLSHQHCQNVKNLLVHELSRMVLEYHLQSTGPSSHIQEKIHFDGTVSIERPKLFTDEFDTSNYETISPKPSSPWHKLPFEDFVRAYCQARSRLKPTLHHSLLPSYRSMQEETATEAKKTVALPAKPLAISW